MRLNLPIALAVLVWPCVTDAAQPSAIAKSGAVAVLSKADKATARVHAVQYDVTFDGTAAAESFLPKITGTIRYEQWSSGWPRRFLFDVHIERRRTGERHITAGCDGKRFYLVDHKARTVRTGRNSEVLDELAITLSACLTPEFVVDGPFDEEMAGRNVSLLDDVAIGDEPCHQVHVVYDYPSQPETTWIISREDALPRGRLDKIDLPNGKPGWRRRHITNLAINLDWPDGTFDVPSPDGYERVADE